MAVLFNVCLIASNLFAGKIFQLWDWCVLPGAVIIFPISYILNDCISEVYGFRKANLVIWTGFAMNIFFALMAYLVLLLPGAPFWEGQQAFEAVFASTPRVVLASMAAFFAGTPSLLILKMFSITTMELSTNIPTATARPDREIIFSVTPEKYMSTMAKVILTGMLRRVMNVGFTSLRKSSRIITANRAPQPRLCIMELIMRYM